MHGAAFDEAAKHAFAEPADVLSHAMLGAYSAARWLAPFAKSGTQAGTNAELIQAMNQMAERGRAA
uniref:Uncharacterized protein n=1 Tax=Ralstonia syzygii R24 TaxID=907261 RepID=G3A8S0_9RALS|nr:hypothetical protein RALSY_mp10172 [Ralstonia syzygii R24]